jgi:protein phosphatase
LGGHEGGELASEMAVSIIPDRIRKELKSKKEVSQVIQHAIMAANAEIYKKSQQAQMHKRMACALALALYKDDHAYLSHIGDSRVYLIRHRQLKCLTRDHSIVATLVKLGELSPEETAKHHLRHVISRALGYGDSIEVETQVHPFKKQDFFLLTTDGLTDMLPDAEILRVALSANEPQQMCDRLVDAAKKNGGKDNISLIVVELP